VSRSGDGGTTVVLEVDGSFPSAASVANAALRRALSLDPTVVTCDLSGVTGDLDERTRRELLDTGGYLDHWSGTVVVLVAPRGAGDEPTQSRHPGPSPGPSATRPRARLHLEPLPRASRTARDFVSRTCLDWQLTHVIGSAVLVVSELVTNGVTHAGTPLDVSMSTTGDRLLLGVHDGSDELPRVAPRTGPGRGHGLHIVAGCSRAWGWLPLPDRGKVAWAVLDT
jgi:hypothetical protein